MTDSTEVSDLIAEIQRLSEEVENLKKENSVRTYTLSFVDSNNEEYYLVLDGNDTGHLLTMNHQKATPLIAKRHS